MLLSKSELNLAKLASKEESRYALQGIAVQPNETVVTNGHYLVTVKHSGMSEVMRALAYRLGVVLLAGKKENSYDA